MAATAAERDTAKAVLDLIQGHRIKDRVSEWMKARDLYYSGNWDKIEGHLFEALDEGEIRLPDLYQLLDEVESCGRQRVFLYKLPTALMPPLRDRVQVVKALGAMGAPKNILDGQHQNLAPTTVSVVSARIDAHKLMVKWAEERSWFVHLDTQREGRIETIRREMKTARAVAVLQVDTLTRVCLLKIDQLQSGSDYEELREQFTTLAQPLVDLNAADPINLAKAIAKLLVSKEVVPRSTQIRTPEGAVFGCNSAGKDARFTDTEFYKGAVKQATPSGYTAEVLNAQWDPTQSNGGLKTPS